MSPPELVTEAATDKLAALGAQLARVAHELKLPLSLISGGLDDLEPYVHALLAYVETTSDPTARPDEIARLRTDLAYVVDNAPALLAICREGATRLRGVLDQLSAYSRAASDGPAAPVDVRESVEAAVRLASGSTTVPPRVVVDVPSVPPVAADAQALTRALANLVANAFAALDGTPDPRVTIRARRLSPGRVAVHVRDNGPGVAAAARHRVFDPFFSTKARGPGLGLGLAIAREIVEAHGGTLRLAEPAGRGAEFVVELRAATESD